MSKSTKNEKSFQEKLKSFFKVGIRTLPDPKDSDFVLTTETVADLGIESPEHVRLKAMRDLAPIVRERRLQEHGVELLWVKLQDLLVTSSDEPRQEALTFFEAVIRGQYLQLDTMRAQFFRLVKGMDAKSGNDVNGSGPKKNSDLVHRLNLLKALTYDGRDILHFEDEIGKLILLLFPPVLLHEDSGALYTDFMGIVLNVITYNSTYLDADVICGLVSFISHICVITNYPGNVALCLQCLDAIICYSFIPKEGLVTFISTLCLVINMESQCMEAWRITRNLMGTHLGHSALYSLCQIIQTTENHTNVALVRGAIFFIGMSLWGAQRLKTLANYSATTILPTFVNALGCKHHLIIYEVILQTERLATKLNAKLTATSSDSVLSLVELLLEEIPLHVDVSLQAEIFSHVHNIISSLESLSNEKKYLGSKHKLYNVIDLCSRHRSESSVIGLISYRANMIYPTKPAWIRALCDLVEKYYKNESRVPIRLKTLSVLMDTYKSNRHIYEEDLLERVVLPFLGSADTETSDLVRLEAVKALTTICCESLSRKCFSILEILQRVTQRPIEAAKSGNGVNRKHDDIRMVIEGLISVFCARICLQPSGLVVKIYNVLVQHLEDNYDYPEIFIDAGPIREMIFRLFMRLRANDALHLGVENEDGVVRYSPYILCREPSEEDHLHPLHQSQQPLKQALAASASSSSGDKFKMVAHISLTKACLMVIRCLSQEIDWRVLKLVLVQVPAVLQNKAILSRYGSSIRAFVSPLIELTNHSSKYPDNLTHTEEVEKKKLTRPELHNQVFPVLAAMAPYNEYLDKITSQALIRALQNGLLYRECNRICIVALTACALEMKNSMYSMIPQILNNFSKLSATKQIATPMLEFLSTLIRLPDTFSAFYPTDFMTVLAIALHFTNPFRFDAYTVALAHHVIVMWFLKCKLSVRPNLVKFIIKSLNHNLVRSFEDYGSEFRKGSISVTASSMMAGRQQSVAAAAASAASNVTEKIRERSGSIFRPRSSSFTENTAKNAAQASATQSTAEDESFMKMMAFHQELSETCLDLLARYMFANVSVQQRRLPTADFLLKEGQSASWVMGAMIITITTSRCDHTASRGGLCDRCYLICSTRSTSGHSGRHASSGEPITVPLVDSGDSSRRRHQSDFSKGPSKLPGLPEAPDLRKPLPPMEKLVQNSEESEASTDGQLCQLEELFKKQKENEKKKPEMCACWCTGWAEVHVRRPSGDVSWMCRVQNGSLNSDSVNEFPLADLTAIFQPSMEPMELQDLQTGAKIDTEKLSEDDFISLMKSPAQIGSLSVSESKSVIDPSSSSEVAEDSEFVRGFELNKRNGNDLADPKDSQNLDEESKKHRQSCGPILEDDEGPEEPRMDLTRRRPSLQSPSGSVAPLPGVPLTRAQPASLSTPPRTPVVKEENKSPFFGLSSQTSQPESDKIPATNLRDRAHTISGAGPVRGHLMSLRRGSGSVASGPPPDPLSSSKAEKATGISPQFVFLTLYNSFYPAGTVQPTEKPLLLPATKSIEASLRNIDRIHAHETHKIGVLYVGPNQATNEVAILGNNFGSLRYTDFLNGLGRLISLHDVDKAATYLGGLDTADGDGDFAYMWEDDVMQVIFHVATLMPTNLEKDPASNKKKRHIGNDYVTIVYNDSGNGQSFKLGTVKGQFNYAAVVITPLDQGSNRVEIQCRPELDEPLGHVKEGKTVSDRSLAIVVRQMALHCNLAALIQRSLEPGKELYASNWLERLRAIKRLRDRVTKEQETAKDPREKEKAVEETVPNDFTTYVLRPENK